MYKIEIKPNNWKRLTYEYDNYDQASEKLPIDSEMQVLNSTIQVKMN